MNLSTVIIDGAIKLVQKVVYAGKENRVRLYDPKSRVPEKILFESKTKPGVYLDEVNDKMYHEVNGRWVGI